MRRRDLIALLGFGAALPFAAGAQQGERVRRIGALLPSLGDDPRMQDRVKAFEQGLKGKGWAVGGNLNIDYRFAGTDPERARHEAAELVSLGPEALLAPSFIALQPLRQTTRTIPIVFTGIFDSVGAGFVANFAHPDENITGFTLGETAIGGKLLELLKEAAPFIDHAAVIFNPEQPPQVAILHDLEASAPALGLRLIADPLRDAGDIEPAMELAAREANGGLVVLPSPITTANRDQLTALASRSRIPAIYGFREMVVDGGMMSYGASLIEQYRSAATYIDRLLKGARPADLPVQQPTKFELVINLKAASLIGLDIPASVQLRADEVIE
jgi:putative ABC transport system substrate-binding protein